MAKYFFKLKGLPKSPNAWRGWRARHGDVLKWHEKLIMYMLEHKIKAPEKPMNQAIIKYTRASSQQPDYDNLTISFKSLQDSLIKAGIIENDSPRNISATYHWEHAKPREGYVTIEII